MDGLKLRILKAQLVEIDHCISYWKEQQEEKYKEIVDAIGPCPLCQNHHYPHCNDKLTQGATP